MLTALAYYDTATITPVKCFTVQAQCYKTFYGRNLQLFVISRPSYPSLMFASKAKSFPKRGETESGSTWVGSWGLYYKAFYGRNLRIFVVS